ncbi:stalk domain-containing protein [Paenibacillus xylanexedens]|uniref:stalk domain-containing protein n=1 Tax=Paenibacillus xylanexedens TaxID=528191 RepID=UPI0021B62B26|nr:stalk domain-containing protein [Paenibacillus xylanexedens]
MKKILTKIPTFMLGAIVGVAVTAGSAVGAATYFKATQSNVKVIVDGTQATLSVSPMNIGGKLYLPVRDTANAMGYSVESVTNSQVSLKESTISSSVATSTTSNSSTTTVPNNSTNVNTTSKKVKNLKEMYSTDGKLDAEKIRTALNNSTLGVNDQDSDTGKTLLILAIEENNYEVYKAINRNALDINLQDNQGNSALHISILNKSPFYFGEIMDKKPNVKLKNNEGKTPIDLTDKNSSEQIALNAYMIFNK